MSMQFDEAFKILSDVYGYPKWEINPKEGQSKDEIIRVWQDELRPYSVGQVKAACYRLIKYRKAMTFPTISHLMSELVDVKPEPEENTSDMAMAEKIRRLADDMESRWGKEGRERFLNGLRNRYGVI